jgi:glycosyltransferase involved in cell wall biosynthesis
MTKSIHSSAGGVRRILLLITDLEIGGTPTVVRELATRLNAPPRVEVEVACLKGWGPVADQLNGAGVAVTAYGARRPWELPAAVRRLREHVRGRGIDTVFSFLVHANVVAARAAAKLPAVRFLQSIQTIQPRPRWHWLAQQWAHRSAERIVVPSTAIVRMAGRRSGIDATKCVVIPNAIDPDAFERANVFHGPIIRAGYLGRLDPAKSPRLLLASLSDPTPADAELHYFGDGPERAALEHAAAQPEFRGRVFIHGAVARPQDALRQMDVLWQPSSVEGFGLVVLEAMASGVPVVATGAGGETDIITDGENGLLAADATAVHRRFAESLHTLRDDPTLRQRLIDNGLRTVRERYTWDVVLPQYRKLLDL